MIAYLAGMELIGRCLEEKILFGRENFYLDGPYLDDSPPNKKVSDIWRHNWTSNNWRTRPNIETYFLEDTAKYDLIGEDEPKNILLANRSKKSTKTIILYK